MRIYGLNLKAGDVVPVHAMGSEVRLTVASGPIEIDIQGYGKAQLEVGQGVRTANISSPYVVSRTDQYIELIFSAGEFIDDRMYGFIHAQIRQGAGVSSYRRQVEGVESEIVEPDSVRLSATIKNIGPADILIGQLQDVATGGYPLKAGESKVIDKAAAGSIFAVAVPTEYPAQEGGTMTATSAEIAILEQRDVAQVIQIHPDTLTTDGGAPIYAEDGSQLQQG